MMRRGVLTGRRHKGTGAAIEMAPLIDMVFILLIFYIVSTSFVQDAGVVINRPESRSAQPVTTRYLPVAITKTGTVHVAGRIIAPDETAPIEAALKDMNARRVVIQADREVPTSLLLRVLDTCKAAGAETVDVAAIAK
ncbi:MAG: biopolymer transporter ExbD [Phycisphaerae bacterium]